MRSVQSATTMSPTYNPVYLNCLGGDGGKFRKMAITFPAGRRCSGICQKGFSLEVSRRNIMEEYEGQRASKVALQVDGCTSHDLSLSSLVPQRPPVITSGELMIKALRFARDRQVVNSNTRLPEA